MLSPSTSPLEKWDVSKVTDMSGMFLRAKSFNQPLEKWDVSKVTDMSWMFWSNILQPAIGEMGQSGEDMRACSMKQNPSTNP